MQRYSISVSPRAQCVSIFGSLFESSRPHIGPRNFRVSEKQTKKVRPKNTRWKAMIEAVCALCRVSINLDLRTATTHCGVSAIIAVTHRNTPRIPR